MNFTETFDQFTSRLTPTDLALYAGVALIMWVLFKDKLGSLPKLVSTALELIKNNLPKLSKVNTVVPTISKSSTNETNDDFYDLILSWKKTRDLAIKTKCFNAVKEIDKIFPYLNPSVCRKEDSNENNA